MPVTTAMRRKFTQRAQTFPLDLFRHIEQKIHIAGRSLTADGSAQ